MTERTIATARRSIAILLLLIAAALLFTGCSSIREMKEFSETVQFTDPELDEIADGSYFGAFEIGLVSVELEVALSNHRISGIDIIRHDNGKGGKAENIVYEVVEQQSLQVDVISGATYSSQVILKAIENALSP